MKKVFISHSIEDTRYVQMLKANLLEFEINVWDATGELSPGESWEKKLVKQIMQSDVVLVLVSNKSKESSWLAFEAGTALSYGKKLLLLSLSKDSGDLPSYLKNFHTIDLTNTSLSDVANYILAL